MTFYHASNHKDLTEILPLSFPKSGDEKVCYFTPSRNYALFYLRDLEINAVTGGVKDDGIIDYDEFCPNQLEILYKGRSGYIYSVENNSEITLGHTSGIWTATQPVPITAVEYIDDVYAEILKLIESGECKITRYEDWTDGEKQTHTAQMRSYIIKNKFFTDKPNRTHYFYSNFFERKDYKPMSYKINTKCIQSGYAPKNGEPRVLPIYQSTTYKYESSEQMGNLFDLKEEGYFYSRLQNPTNDAVAAKIADLEGGVAAILTSSGQAATFYSVFNICGAGAHVVCSTAVYGGTFNLFNVTMRKLGVDFTFVDPDLPEEELLTAFKPNTKAVFAETLANPSMVVLDIEKFARIAHANGVPLIVDNTFPTPINLRPFEFGADIITHSTSKYMDGHAVCLGGAVVDSGNFDWTKYKDKYPGLTTPDDSYHGVIYTEKFGKKAYITKCVSQLMRDLGSVPSPQNSFLLNLGLETLFLRVPRHCENALAAAKYLENSSKVAWVNYPDLPSNKYYALTQKYMPNGTSGVISFGIKGGKDNAVKFMDNLKLAAVVTHVADARTCVLHPASTTHRQLSDEQLIASGVGPDMIRLSVGIEDAEDIINDLEQALNII